MISKKYKCIFVHIPKTAGQSIEHFFLNLHGLTWETRTSLLLKYNPDKAKGPERLAHLTASEYVSCGHIHENDFNSYLKFSFVRNPWARLVSEYNYRKHNKLSSFRDFVLNGLPQQNSYTDTFRHIMPQYKFLYDDAGRQLIDFVGKFETLQKDFNFVCNKLNIEPSTLARVNSSSHKGSHLQKLKKLINLEKTSKKINYMKYYNKETRNFVKKIYTKDISIFGYEFDN